jgi:hypothetical protein
MNDQDMMEYTQWILADTAKQLLPAALIYVVVLSAYWTFVA